MDPASLDDFFPSDRQRYYISMLQKREGLTRRRAECFVRLWAYLLLKQQALVGKPLHPITRLYLPEESIPCTLREMSVLFYGHDDRGSDRAAGVMLTRLVDLQLLDKSFDGQTLCLYVRSLPELVAQPQPEEVAELFMDAFNPRTDAVPVGSQLINTHIEIFKDPNAALKVAKAMRAWEQQYPTGMRVLRRSDPPSIAGAYVLYPVTNDSEANFFKPPSASFYLSNEQSGDVFQMAAPGDPSCMSAYIRVWTIDPAALKIATLCLLLEDMQQTLRQMQSDYPQLCDLYGLIVHPRHLELQRALEFELVYRETERPYGWMYVPIDRFVAMDIRQAMTSFKIEETSEFNILE